MHLSDYLFRNAEKWPNQPALVTSDRTITWRELAHEVNLAASALERHLRPSKSQQIVAIVMPNSWQYVVTDLAIVHLGHIALPIEVIFKPMEINAIISQIEPRLTIVDDANQLRVTAADNVLNFRQLSGVSGSPNLLRLDPKKQVACLLFTSGTTGRPKAVPNTHRNHIWNIEVCSQVWDWTHADSLLVSLRLSHMYGLIMGLSGVLYHGNTMYLEEKFDAKQTLEMLASGKISFFSHTALAYHQMLEVHGDYDISKVRLLVSGALPLPPAVWQAFKDRFGQAIAETCGTTETGRIAANSIDDRRPGSPGKLLPSVKAKLSPSGELLIKSEGVFPGYYKNPAANRKAWASGGWLRTGDIASFDGDRLILRGRTHERIRRFGYTISPRDVEWAMHQFPKIKEIHVMGKMTPGTFNDELIYFLVTSASDKEIRVFYKDNLPSVWRPDRIIKLDSLPRTRTGKPQISKLKAMLN